MYEGDLSRAATQFDEILAEAEAVNDLAWRVASQLGRMFLLAYQGDSVGARTAAEAALDIAAELSGFYPGILHGFSAIAHLAEGNIDACAPACETARNLMGMLPKAAGMFVYPLAEVELARGDLAEARQIADQAVSTTKGWHLATALRTRARVALAQRDLEQAEADAHAALARAADLHAYVCVADTFECLGRLAAEGQSYPEGARLLGAAEAMRRRTGEVRFKVYDADFEATVAMLRNAMGEEEFESAWAEGAALSTEDAIAYAQRGRGERKRPSTGWASLTPTELDVVRLVEDGLGNKEIAARLFISHRTVQTHLTHAYTKLGLTSRVQLAQEAAKHA
jgi:DNA-binding NarL/FixJ family response regulator